MMKKSNKFFVLVLILLNTNFFFAYPTHFMLQQNQDKSEIKEIKILHSGFLSKDTLIIRYRASDNEIVEVIDEGKKVPSSRFSKYEPMIRDVLELRKMRELLPEIDEISKELDSPLRPAKLQFSELVEIFGLLDELYFS